MEAKLAGVAAVVNTRLDGLRNVWDFLAHVKEYVVDALVALAKELGLTDPAAIKAFVLDQWETLWTGTVKPWADKLNPMPTPSMLENMLDAAAKAIADRLIKATLDKLLGV